MKKKKLKKVDRNSSEIYADPFAFLKKEAIAEIEDAIEHQFKKKIALDPALLETPPNPQFGDLALPCFSLTKELQASPAEIASKLAADINESIQVGLQLSHGMSVEHIILTLSSARALGPYLNIRFNSPALAHWIVPAVLGNPTYGTGTQKKPKKILIEYVSPNTNKPLHLGHIRNALLGESIARLLEAQGNKVVRTCLINDRGIHICKSMTAYKLQAIRQRRTRLRRANYKLVPTPKSVGKKGDHFVGDYYVLYEKMLQQDESIAQKAHECLQKWEAGNTKLRALWKRMNAWALQGMKETLQKLGIVFDTFYFESDIYAKGKSLVEQYVKKRTFSRDETGAVYADFKGALPNKILLRKDGTSLYITQDMYLAIQRVKQYKPDASLYVVASEQNLYFQQLFKVLEMMKVPSAQRCHHISYGMVYLPDGKMKSREGTVVDADDLLAQIEKLATSEIKKREKKLPTQEVLQRARTIALAALKFYMLEVTPKSDMTFNPATALALQGKTGPYLLYTYARLLSILRKSEPDKQCDMFAYTWNKEQKLLLQLGQFPEIIRVSSENYSPAMVVQYLFSLAQDTNDYYHAVPILSASHEERCARLLLIASIARVLKKGLTLLGIETLEKM
ncbi:arginine--tRNA ligase [Candidatus Uhrbacteria bacterium]|nr:arginine--tRNA ligase [Candidatus Uhrbacteria bacterium]